MGNSTKHEKKEEKNVKEADNIAGSQIQKVVNTDVANFNTVSIDEEAKVSRANLKSPPLRKFNSTFLSVLVIKHLM